MTVVIILATDDVEWTHATLVKSITEASKLLWNKGDRILCVVGKEKDSIEMFIQDVLDSNLLSLITIVIQPVSKGTGHAVICCLPYLKPADKVLIMSGVFPCMEADAMRDILKYPVGKDRVAIMTTKMENPGNIDRVICKNKIVKIVGFADCDDREDGENIVNCGVYFGLGEMFMLRGPFLTSGIHAKYPVTNIVNDIGVDIFYSSNIFSGAENKKKSDTVIDDSPF